MRPTTGDKAAVPATIVVVDDDRGVRESMCELLAKAGYRVEAFATAEALLAAVRNIAKDCLVIDVCLPGGVSGFELLARLTAEALPVILITGYSDEPMGIEAMRAGVVDFLEKPVRPERLLSAIERALQHREK